MSHTERDMVLNYREKNRPWRFIADALGRNEMDLRRTYDLTAQVASNSEPPVTALRSSIVASIRSGVDTAPDLAEHLNVSRYSVSSCLTALRDMGMVSYTRDGSRYRWRIGETE